MFTNSVLVTGCNRGIGLELVKQLAPQTKHLFAGCLYPHNANEIDGLSEHHKHVVKLHLDVTNHESITHAVSVMEGVLASEGEGLNCVINNAGVLPVINSINDVTVQQLANTFDVNAIGPTMVSKACLPLLKKASAKESGNRMGVSRAAVLNISSTAGSMENPRRMDKLFYTYRPSKMALNMFARNLSIGAQEDNILVCNVNPGWVQTDMGGPEASRTVQEAVESMLFLMSTFDGSNTAANAEGFYNWNGEVIPW